MTEEVIKIRAEIDATKPKKIIQTINRTVFLKDKKV